MFNILIATITLSIISFVSGSLLGYISHRFKTKENPLIQEIKNYLPQSQCGQCGYVGCDLYAKAIIENMELINKCEAGGKDTIKKLANLLNIDLQTIILDKNIMNEYQIEKSVWIDEKKCVGCNKCVQSCPVDAIIGTVGMTHTVITKICNGCLICVKDCPIDCIHIKI